MSVTRETLALKVIDTKAQQKTLLDKQQELQVKAQNLQQEMFKNQADLQSVEAKLQAYYELDPTLNDAYVAPPTSSGSQDKKPIPKKRR